MKYYGYYETRIRKYMSKNNKGNKQETMQIKKTQERKHNSCDKETKKGNLKR